MEYRTISQDSILKIITKKDKLFGGDYCIDTYQNCEFGCKYCDSSIDKVIYVKLDADKILEKKLRNIKKGVIIVGSVNDPYQKSEEKHEITKKVLKIIKKYEFSCHILTKSNLILRDIDLLKDMDCLVTISLISLNETITQIFEKNVMSTKYRLKTVEKLVNNGIKTGVALIPLIPTIIDTELDKIVKISEKYKAQHFLHKFLELKGDQKELFLKIISTNYPLLLSKFKELYKDRYQLEWTIVDKYNQKISNLCNRYNISEKIYF